VANAESPQRYIRTLFACIMLSLLGGVVPTAAEAKSSSLDRVERTIVRKLNGIRKASGLPRLQSNRALSRSADFHCRDMLAANFFAHPSSNGQGMAERVESFRRSSWVGETLAYVPSQRRVRSRNRQATRIVNMWMASPPHRASLLDGRFTRIGVARRRGVLGSQRAIVFTADLASKH
jgi:uncharacterized protein YkwD